MRASVVPIALLLFHFGVLTVPEDTKEAVSVIFERHVCRQNE